MRQGMRLFSSRFIRRLFVSDGVPVYFVPLLLRCIHSRIMFSTVFRSVVSQMGFFTTPNTPLLPMPSVRPFPTAGEDIVLPVLPFGSDRGKTDAEIEALESAVRVSNFKPTLFSIRDIMLWMDDHSTASNAVKYYILAGCDSAVIPSFPAMANSVRQVASQFNLGESPDRCLMHPKQFQYDPTQGPSEQRTAFCAALSRWIYRDECDSLSRLKLYPEFSRYFDYQFGYLTPKNGFEVPGLAFLRAHVNEIELNVQRVRIDGAPHYAIQVLNAGLALGSYDLVLARTEKGNQCIAEMSAILLTAQYEAVAAVAIQEACIKPAIRIPLCLTLVGAGVFGNDVNAVKKAIAAACDLVEKSGVTNIDICLSAYRDEEAVIFSTPHFRNAPVIDQDTLSRLSSLSDYAPPSATP